MTNNRKSGFLVVFISIIYGLSSSITNGISSSSSISMNSGNSKRSSSSSHMQSTIVSCSLNSMCQCSSPANETSILEIICSQVSLYKFPEFLPGTVKHIEVSKTFLQNIDDETFQGLRLEVLKLVDNKIYEFSEKSFSAMYHTLLSLDISGNLLQYLPLRALKNVHTLNRLVAQRNHIQDLEGNWGSLSDTLRTLHLSGNSLIDVSINYDDEKLNISSSSSSSSSSSQQQQQQISPLRTFTKLRKLIWLDLSGNRISHINSNVLPKSLMTIDLSRNLLPSIPRMLFQHLRNLKIISFKDNIIRYVNDVGSMSGNDVDGVGGGGVGVITHASMPNGVGGHHGQMEKIDFSYNSIEEITGNLLNTSIRVKALNFDKNFIRFIPNRIFSGLGCVHLVLSFNFIEEIEKEAFYGLENTLEYLDLERNRLATIPDALFLLNKLRYLYFTANNIAAVTNLPSTLKILSLSGNNFSSIPSDGLANCTELSYLNMGYNKISEIRENEFFGWGSQIQTLLLRNNKITSLNFGAFNGLDSIKEISLSFNDIHYVHPNVFENISQSLKILELSFGIYRDDFPLEALCHLNDLMWLSLDNNNIKIVSENSLAFLAELTYINFAFNRIAVLPKHLFLPESHQNLIEIDLSFNLIEKINSNSFDDLTELQLVHLSSNQITTIERHSFHNLPILMYIDLTHNQMRNISEEAFAHLPAILRIDMMHNDLTFFSLKYMKYMANASHPMSLNLSYNRLWSFDAEATTPLYIYKIDLSHNHIGDVSTFQSVSASLRFLHMPYNNLSSLSNHHFGDIQLLEILELSNNQIGSLRRRSFQGLPNLQELYLSHNRLELLQVEQFSNLKNLRLLKLNGNKLKTLPPDVFLNTRIELLDLTDNLLNTWPTTVLSDIGFTLRSIQFGGNILEYLDSSMFINVQFLREVNLTRNKISLLPDTTFNPLARLSVLDLSHNPLVTTNFNELFIHTPNLRILNLQGTGLYTIPSLILQHLTELDVSQNYLHDIQSFNEMRLLRVLNISNNKIIETTNFGKKVPSTLEILDLSNNPIRKMSHHDFHQLRRLRELTIENVKITANIFSNFHSLRKLTITSQPKIGEFVSSVPGLRRLIVTIHDDIITDELFAKMITNTKLLSIEITGPKLKRITSNAFYGLSRNHDLILSIHDTSIDDLPPGIFYSLKDIPRLTIDLSHNLLNTLSPDSFYPNASSWDAVGTRSVLGGLDVAHNPLQCDCGLVWLGHWLRRWLRETTQAKMTTKEDIKVMMEKSRQSTCYDQMTGKEFTLLEIFPEDLLCHASALSSRSNKTQYNPISTTILLFFIPLSNVFLFSLHRQIFYHILL